ncbi:SDR family oxidoreductase [Phycicoccus flavus]|uniref:SDR family oxidoreductase n=1 Tax=Phycicoccus flavus TaxID=2502783 RepID=UPI000FEC13C8|nr:SDR family oxidoreductase [Phycicoccus flavus]NHA69426.1 SDR family oxidoreductase [Phycicoccus flavus]
MSDTRENPTGRIAVVTGASAGVGRAVALELAGRGYDVALLARGQAGLDAAAEEVRALGRRALPVSTDVSDHRQVDAAAERIEAELGPIDLWVNNAMTTVFARLRDIEAEEFERATRVTYLGQLHGALAALRYMRPRDRGTVVFIGSALAYRGIPLQSAYCGAKFAVRGLHDSLRCELLEEGSNVRTTIVHLPAVNTTQFGWCLAKVDRHPMPVPPIYEPERVARSIADAAEALPRQKVVGTWNWMVVQMAQLMPGVGDHYMARTGVSGQLTDQRIDPGRRDNLHTPVDREEDHGPRGIFGDQADGVLTPSFLRSLPSQALSFALAIGDRALETARQRRPLPLTRLPAARRQSMAPRPSRASA